MELYDLAALLGYLRADGQRFGIPLEHGEGKALACSRFVGHAGLDAVGVLGWIAFCRFRL